MRGPLIGRHTPTRGAPLPRRGASRRARSPAEEPPLNLPPSWEGLRAGTPSTAAPKGRPNGAVVSPLPPLLARVDWAEGYDKKGLPMEQRQLTCETTVSMQQRA